MNNRSVHNDEGAAAEAFSRQAPVFDDRYEGDGIIRYKRARVRSAILALLQPGARMLELNCGTGNDALFFAQRGFRVHATDLSAGMLHRLEAKLQVDPGLPVSTEQCSFLQLDALRARGPYDHIYSNFGGLNCTADLDLVLRSSVPLLRPGGTLTLVLISKFCFWETLMAFRGKFRTAFRRFFSNGGRRAEVEGKAFRCWYYSPRQVGQALPEFDLLQVEGLCTLVPPSYIEGFAEKHPGLFAFLRKAEDRWRSRWPFRAMGDYFIINLRKKG